MIFNWHGSSQENDYIIVFISLKAKNLWCEVVLLIPPTGAPCMMVAFETQHSSWGILPFSVLVAMLI
jgi:hypothetical protein